MSRSPRRLHERKTFFKYVTADVAALVLETHKLRWSSPLLFDDPFDVPREMSFGVTARQLSTAVGDRVIALLKNPPDDISGMSPKLQLILAAVKQHKSEKLTEELIESVRESVATATPAEGVMDSFRALWREQIPNFRILCLCARNESASMWLHYAEKYTGAVIELEVSDERDSVLLMAREVTYSDRLTDLQDAEGWAKYIVMNSDKAVRQILHDATYIKAKDWSYEHEWRVASFGRSGETGLYGDYGFAAEDILSVYLGPRVSKKNRTRLVGLANRLPNAKVFDTEILLNREFFFKEVAR